MAIFIPNKLKIGFQKREDTVSNKLAYIIYYDEKNKLRKESSWRSWIDKSIEQIECENKPIEGFILNKKVGDCRYNWNHRQAYCRIYDPRNFEFEITIDNLLFILANTNSINGKLEGSFVFAWDQQNLVLLPTESPDYIEISNNSNILKQNLCIKEKDLKIGTTYKTKDNLLVVYLGKYDYYNDINHKTKKFYFKNITKNNEFNWFFNKISNNLISVVNENCDSDLLAKWIKSLDYEKYFSPVDLTKVEWFDYTFEEFKTYFEEQYCTVFFYNNMKEKCIICKSENLTIFICGISRMVKNSIEDVYEILKPKYKKIYLLNGNYYRKEF